MGITRVANVTGLDCIGIPVVMVCRPNARSLAVSQGKGLDLDAARASGLMESAELYHAERVSHPLKLGSWHDLRFSHDLVSVEDLPRTSASPYTGNTPLLWIEGFDLLGSKPVWMPYELVHMNYSLPLPTGSGCFVMSSNGLASGNNLLEAINHGISEVIERDATTLFLFGSLAEQHERRIDLDTVRDERCRSVLTRYEKAGIAVGVWDVTSDTGIPAFQCVIVDRNTNPFRALGPVEGMGCHTTREVALLRALTEAAQARLTLIAGSRDDTGRARYRESRDRALIEQANERLLRTGTRSFELVPTMETESFEADLDVLLDGLRRAGVESALVVDLSKPAFGISVVRVVVPGLETYHHVPGYLPGARARPLLDRRREEHR
jgi:ribosomal protein S12 methylthiotransferase accessory factor